MSAPLAAILAGGFTDSLSDELFLGLFIGSLITFGGISFYILNPCKFTQILEVNILL